MVPEKNKKSGSQQRRAAHTFVDTMEINTYNFNNGTSSGQRLGCQDSRGKIKAAPHFME